MTHLNVYQLGKIDYASSYAWQKEFTANRETDTVDQIWCLEHYPIYTLGLSGKSDHILSQNNIPIYHADRGGQVTYHGPGQLVIYLLLDLKRKDISVKKYVNLLEQAIICMLHALNISANRKIGAPGVYVNEKKIAALGIRIRKGCCYHGISLNVDMDLSPYAGINPCGYPDLAMTQIADFGKKLNVTNASLDLIPHIVEQLDYENYSLQDNGYEKIINSV
ncbi:MAG: lipoyl(octanoyl) transferase LipB [Gammaproteobacteria bacterium]|jgi:lipoyl(octanoyl) transferase